ncbi:uncharacterized protein [Panulirus ornatus]|uniref:uncharacterized protein n=1 Tax=Panulirus ornatus TaxID=150431 RepID=UPI003A85D941
MFVSGGLPWEVPPPLGGILGMLEGKEGVRASLLLPPPVPRTAACVVLSQPTVSPTPTIPLSPRHTPTPAHVTYTKASSPPSAPPLKFGVERLLAAEPRRELPPPVLPPTPHIYPPPHVTSSIMSSLAGAATTCPVISSAVTTSTCPSMTSSVTCPVMTSCVTSPGGCRCDGSGGKCPSDCGYYYAPLYATHPAHLLPYGPLYGGSLGGASSRPEVLGVGVSPGTHGRRKRTWTRAVFSNLQRKGLEKRFQLQKYITKPDRRQLAATLGLTDAQVKVWFQNRRMKWRHAELKKREQQQLQQQQQKQEMGLREEAQVVGREGEGEEDEEEEEEEEGLPEHEMNCLEGRHQDDDDEDEEIDLGEGNVRDNMSEISVV